MRSEIERVLNERVRPKLALHRGDLEVVKYENGVVHVRLLGQCSNCPASYLTTEQLIQAELSEALPEIKSVMAEHSISADLLEQAKMILEKRHG